MEFPKFTGNLYRSPEDVEIWLRQSDEAPIDPEVALVDAHHHLWNDERGRYELPQLAADIGDNNVVATVHVECGTAYEASVHYDVDGETPLEPHLRPVAETEYIVSALGSDQQAKDAGACRGIVGFVNLLLEEASAREILEAHVEAGDGRFCGIRQSSGWDPAIGALAYRNPPPGLLLDQRFRSGFSALAPLGLTYDVWIFYPQIPDLIDLADEFPDTSIILDHFGGLLGIGPYSTRRDEVFLTWRHYLRRLGERPNVVLKMGGLGMIASGSTSHLGDQPATSEELADRWRPYVETAVETFGANRCMVGSNFPVDRQSSTYTALWNAYKLCTRQYSDPERRSILSDTALRIYGLQPVPVQEQGKPPKSRTGTL